MVAAEIALHIFSVAISKRWVRLVMTAWLLCPVYAAVQALGRGITDSVYVSLASALIAELELIHEPYRDNGGCRSDSGWRFGGS